MIRMLKTHNFIVPYQSHYIQLLFSSSSPDTIVTLTCMPLHAWSWLKLYLGTQKADTFPLFYRASYEGKANYYRYAMFLSVIAYDFTQGLCELSTSLQFSSI